MKSGFRRAHNKYAYMHECITEYVDDTGASKHDAASAHARTHTHTHTQTHTNDVRLIPCARLSSTDSKANTGRQQTAKAAQHDGCCLFSQLQA